VHELGRDGRAQLGNDLIVHRFAYVTTAVDYAALAALLAAAVVGIIGIAAGQVGLGIVVLVVALAGAALKTTLLRSKARARGFSDRGHAH
jgi:hypothetical protein